MNTPGSASFSRGDRATLISDGPDRSLAISYLILPLAAALALSLLTLGDWCRLTPDSFKYLLAARSVRETGAFPAERLVAPPGFPLMLSPIMSLGDTPFLAIRIFLSGCYCASVVLTVLLLRMEIGRKAAVAAALLTATSGLMLVQSATLLSEIPYMPFVLGSLALTAHWRRGGCRTAWQATAGGLLVGCTTLVRSMGIIVAPIMAACLLLDSSQPVRRRLIHAGSWAACFSGLLIGWEVRQYSYPSGYDYGVQWSRARDVENTSASGATLQLQRLGTFGPLRMKDIKSAMVPTTIGWRAFEGPLEGPSTWAVALLIIGAALYRLIKYRGVVDVYVLATLGMLALWPWDEGARLVVPMLPIFWGYVAWISVGLFDQARNRIASQSVLATAFLLLLCVQVGELWFIRKSLINMGIKEKARWSRAGGLAHWQANRLPKGAGVLGVTLPGHNDKLVLAGASFLSHRPMLGYYEVNRSIALPVGSDRAACVILQAGIRLADCELPLGSRLGTASGFSIYRYLPSDGSRMTRAAGESP